MQFSVFIRYLQPLTLASIMLCQAPRLLAQEHLPDAYYQRDLYGYCFLHPGSAPASGLELQLFDHKNRLIASTAIREDGSFLFPDIAQQDHLRLKAPRTAAGIRLITGHDPQTHRLHLLSDSEGNFEYRQFDHPPPLFSEAEKKLHGQLIAGKTTVRPPENIEIRLTDRQGKPLQHTRTDHEGVFTFEHPSSLSDFLLQSDVSEFYTLLLFSKDGYVSAELQRDENHFYTYLRLPETYRSRDWQAGTAAIPDIPQTLTVSGQFNRKRQISFLISDENGRFLLRDTSDAKGFFRITQLPLHSRYVIQVNADTSLQLELKRPLEKRAIVLQPDRAGRFIYVPSGEKGNRPSLLADEAIGFAERLYLVYFEKEKSDLSAETLSVLDKIAGLLKSDKTLKISLEAHSDTQGEADYNQLLSEQRAQAISRYLHHKGIDPQRIQSRAYGDTRPLTPCHEAHPCAEETHTANRRCELKIYR